MDTQIFRSKYLTLKLDGQIMVMTYADDLTIDLEAAKIMVAERLSVFSDQSYPVLADARFIKFATREALDYFAGKDGVKGISVLAILIGNYLTVTLANIFIRLRKPAMRTKVFNTKDQAMKWLMEYSKMQLLSKPDG